MPLDEIARSLGCATRTVRRWKTLRCVPAVAARLARVLVFGELEQIDKRWAGWRIRGDRLHNEDLPHFNLRPVSYLVRRRQLASIPGAPSASTFAA
jgi:hypothetical protein